MNLLYSLGIRTYSGLVALASLFGNRKARFWWKGRKNQWNKLKSTNKNDEWIWFHVSSLGEFEQGLPVLENIKQRFPKYKILLTFFSPSGYEPMKDFHLADKVAYMPSDTKANAKKLVANFNIKAAFFVKYDFWFNYMKELKKNNLPLYYISALLQPEQYFFKFYASWFRRQLKNVTHYFVQNEETAELLKSIGINNFTITGDTRFDRVYETAKQAQSFPEIEKFIDGRTCMIAGSTWPSDERFVIPFIKKLPEDYCLIIAPHEISESHINQITSQISDYQLYTKIDNSRRCKILIIDTIGILRKIYKYARFAYIGGGFISSSIHNTQEALIFGCPVVIGPRYHGFIEAVDLVKKGGMFVITKQEEFDEIFNKLINDGKFYDDVSKICKDYTQISIGATQKILNHLEERL